VCAFPASPEPFRIEPIFSPRIWGSRSLAPLFPEKSNLAEPVGEAWLTGTDCTIASGAYRGKALGVAWEEMPAEWRGLRLVSCPDFPILVKFIFPNDKLSIQVHPDDAYARKHEQAAGGRGKTEIWHAVSAVPKAQVLIGLKSGVDKQQFCDALAQDRLEELFETHPVQAGDTFFIPAGTPHTIGPGMVICEVQEYSDLTYRVYDYGRVDAHGKPRELHVQKALDVMSFGAAAGGKTGPVTLRAKAPKRLLVAACRYFAAETWELLAPCEAESEPECFHLLAIMSGQGKLEWPGGVANYRSGECWFQPALQGTVTIRPSERTSLMRAYVPDISALPSRLKQAGVPARTIAQAVFD
jgi:mannose-6-phosphate isomerase